MHAHICLFCFVYRRVAFCVVCLSCACFVCFVFLLSLLFSQDWWRRKLNMDNLDTPANEAGSSGGGEKKTKELKRTNTGNQNSETPNCKSGKKTVENEDDSDFDDLMQLIEETGSELNFNPLDMEFIERDEGKIYKSNLHVPRGVWENAEERTDDATDEEVLGYAAKDDAAEAKLLQSTNNTFSWTRDFTHLSARRQEFKQSDIAVEKFETPFHAFYSIWDRETVQKIADETNKYARTQILHSKRPHRQWKDTDADELYMLFAFFVLVTWTKLTARVCFRGLCSVPVVQHSMSPHRFKALIQCLHFVDNSTLSNLTGVDLQIAKVKPIVDHCSSKFESLYNLNQNITINDSMPVLAGQYIYDYLHAKGSGTGKRLFELSDAHTGYVWRVWPHGGRNQQIDPADEFGYGTVVLKLTEGIRDKGHTLLMDKCLNSPTLSRYLKQQGTDVVGPVRACRAHVPQEIKSLVDAENLRKGQRVSLHCGDLSINTYVERIRSRYFDDSLKLNNILSTFHDNSPRESNAKNKKPDALTSYENTLQCVDNRDKELESRGMPNDINTKWYILAFTRLLNVTVWNAYILYLRDDRGEQKRMKIEDFQSEISTFLIERHISQATVESIQNTIRFTVDAHFPMQVDELKKLAKYSRDPCKCACCKVQGKDKDSKYACRICQVPLCITPCFSNYHTIKNLRELSTSELDDEMDWTSTDEEVSEKSDVPDDD